MSLIISIAALVIALANLGWLGYRVWSEHRYWHNPAHRARMDNLKL